MFIVNVFKLNIRGNMDIFLIVCKNKNSGPLNFVERA